MNIKEDSELPFKSKEFNESWGEWIQYRKERRLPKYVPTGLKKTFAKLVRESENNEATAIAMINQSIEQNYQGIFPLKNSTNAAAPKPGTPTNRKGAGAKQLLDAFKANLGAHGAGK